MPHQLHILPPLEERHPRRGFRYLIGVLDRCLEYL
jgi:hypothetical protein